MADMGNEECLGLEVDLEHLSESSSSDVLNVTIDLSETMDARIEL
jgi:hypothetical protein